MFTLGNSKELYTRSGRDANSEKWSQQFLNDSQDWSSQFFTPQDIQRQPAAASDRISSFMQSSSQGSTRGNRGASQGGISKGDVYLAREIRFGLHTILSVMRELPERLKDINEVLRASQQPEETNCLIKETSEKLEGLVVGLEKKLTDLLENKENSDNLQRETNEKLTNIILGLETRVMEALENSDIKDTLQNSLSENNEQLKTAIAEVVRDLTSQSKENELAMLEEQRNITKKEVHRELKKFREIYSDMKNHLEKSLDERMSSINEDVTKLYGKVSDHKKALQSVTSEIKSLINEKQSDIDKHLEESLKEVLSLLNSIVNKVTGLPEKIHVEVCQAVNDAVQNLHIPGGVSSIQNVSPSERMMAQHRPVMPFSQRFLRSQVSPIAQVHPQIFQSNTPSLVRKTDTERENEFITPVSSSQKRLSNLRPISQVEASVNFPENVSIGN
ncbi:putative leucine-rich repeat-containing protein DDB_G0290503 [Palaemon carinicauda]|uniref:putative leucine-rich repeat-containing protein DDB_G0290503 n=1 Tax=Palaemon carinicauda TaxID=392227 RepID=UPI0035B6247A